ncbi:tRNA methyltransferase 6 non-catalytic subunit [Rhodnius prolixus]|uniref:tRNA (adenine(58)-N(1))-methyltransferase non-catalytic subunit TRM6 n=1 Tax=Rhodnius prolixus TaxID=13249 RepID=R4G3X1_RHOPR
MHDAETVPRGNLITVGDYIIIQRQGYFKLHQLSQKCDLMLGKDKVNISCIVGKPFWTMFKMIPVKSGKREFYVEVCSKCESIPEVVMKEIPSGMDNRNISDDGKSQMLTTEDIVGLRESGLSAQNIVDKLIQNSTTFKEKTEYSQEKYLKKKEKKYFEYIVIRKPTLRLIVDIFYNRDPFKILGLRYDTISQILSLGNIQHNGTYFLYESGTQALVGASILNSLSEYGSLINLSLVNQPPKQAILGMNFDRKQNNRLLTVKISDFLRALRGDLLTVPNQPESQDSTSCDFDNVLQIDGKIALEESSRKRKINENDHLNHKKPKWAEEFERAVDIVKEKSVDGIIIASKEHPLNILENLITYLKPSKQIVIYSLYREPLIDTYVEMKKRKDLIAIHLTESWLRTYQILPDRTHPDVNMSASGGHLLTATKVV